MNERVPRLPDLARQVSRSTNRLVDLSRTAGHPALGEMLIAAADRWPDEDTTVLVIGERGSGKSSLVNALAGRLAPPLLPIGAGVTVVRAGADEVRVHRPGNPVEVHPLDAGRLETSVDCTIEVLVADPPLGHRVVLIDTPALGEVGSGSSAMVAALASTCDAVVLTTAADAPLTATEIDLLAAVRSRAGAALVVTTKTDRFRGWRTVIEESAASVIRRDPDLLIIPPLPFSMAVATDAAQETEPDTAAALADESGLSAILDALGVRVRDRFRHVRLAGLARAAIDVTERLMEEVGGNGVEDPGPTLAEERSRLRERSRTVPVDFADGCAILRESVNVEIGREVQSIIEAAEADLERHGDLEALIEATWQHLDAVRLRSDARIKVEMDALLEQALAAIVADPADEDDGGGGPTPDERPAWAASASKVSTALRLRLLQAAVSTTGGATMLYAMAVPSGDGLRAGAMGISMLIGGIGAAEAFRESRQQKSVQEARAQVRSVVEQWRATYLASAREHMLRQQRERERLLRDTIASAVADIDAQLASPGGREAQADDPTALAAELQAVRHDLERTLATIHGGSVAGT